MVFMALRWVTLGEIEEFYVNVCIIGGVFEIVVLLGIQSINI